jgi:hypothetical protein
MVNDRVESLLADQRVREALATVLGERRGIWHPVRQPQAGEPPVGNIDVRLAHEPALAAHPKQVADKQQPEHHHRIERGSPVIRAVQVRHLRADELELDRRVDLAQQVVPRHEFLECHHFEFVLAGVRFPEHPPH